MTVAELEHFRDLLTERQQGLLGWLNLSESDYADGAMKVRSLLTEIKDALSRVDSGTFGICDVCKGEVELERLETQPVRDVCLECITATERRVPHPKGGKSRLLCGEPGLRSPYPPPAQSAGGGAFSLS